MSRHYHIITCDDENALNNFVNIDRVGIHPVLTNEPKRKEGETEDQRIKRWVSNTVQMNWDILADIARVKEGDYVLLHAKGIIQGVFEVVSNPIIEQRFVQYFNGPNIDTGTWRSNWNVIQNIIRQNQYIWWIPIQPVNNLFFEKMDMDVVFRRIAEGKITSIPQRLIYEDKKKTVKGVTKTDFEKIVDLFYNYSSHATPSSQTSSPFQNTQPIDFDYLTNDEYEKNLEAIIVHRVRSNTMRIIGLNFSHTNILNTVPLGYLKMADVLTWSERNKIINPWIWELMDKANSNVNNYIILENEIKNLNIRASYISKLLWNGYKITGAIVAKKFSNDVLTSFNNIITPVGSLEEIILISYKGTGRNVNFKLIARK